MPSFRACFRVVFGILPIALIVLFLAGCGGTTPASSTSATQPVSVSIYQTTGNGSSLLASQPAQTFGTAAATGSFTIQVTPSNVLQPWDGVGGALTDSAATVIAALPQAQQQTVLSSLFSQTNGIGLTMVRLPMGASDFIATTTPYSYDDVPTGQTDTTLAQFSIAHDMTNIIPVLQSALTINPGLKVIASPWSPPAWMKTNGSIYGVTNASTATSQVNAADFVALSNYFVKFVQAYKAQGVPIYAVSAQNEPLNTSSTYPTAILTATDESNFIANDLGPALSTAGLSSVKIFGLEDNWNDGAYAQTVLQSAALSYVAGSSFHWYNGTVGSMSTVEALNANKGVWFTEATDTVSCGTTCPTLTGPIFTASGFALQMQSLIIGVPQNYGRSVVGWNLALNQNEGPHNGGCADCVGILTINSSTSPASVYNNTLYYALGHIGKFVSTGAFVIGTTTQGTTGVEDVGFLNPDGSLVVVAYNGATSATPVTVAWNGENFDYTIPAGAAVTFKWLP